MKHEIRFRLSKNNDPEERLEEAALWKAMHDEYGDQIAAIGEDDATEFDGAIFGRQRRTDFTQRNPVSWHLPYWEDPAFLENCRREFSVCRLDEVAAAVSALHTQGKGAFIKSTKSKHVIFRVPVGEDPLDVIDAMAYSFMDGGPDLMVQELCQVEFEYRFMCIDREIVTGSPIQWALTPIDGPLTHAAVYQTPKSIERVTRPTIYASLLAVGRKVAETMTTPHASIDCAMINGVAGVVELNPMQLGQLGLYACDVRALAKASRRLLA